MFLLSCSNAQRWHIIILFPPSFHFTKYLRDLYQVTKRILAHSSQLHSITLNGYFMIYLTGSIFMDILAISNLLSPQPFDATVKNQHVCHFACVQGYLRDDFSGVKLLVKRLVLSCFSSTRELPHATAPQAWHQGLLSHSRVPRVCYQIFGFSPRWRVTNISLQLMCTCFIIKKLKITLYI